MPHTMPQNSPRDQAAPEDVPARAHGPDEDVLPGLQVSRRAFLQSSGVLAGTIVSGGLLAQSGIDASSPATTSASPATAASDIALAPLRTRLRINGSDHEFNIEARTTLLDVLREYAALPGTKKGCDRGQCGACTVLINGRRVNACLSLAVMHQGDEIVTIEGLGKPDVMHPMQAAFVEHDAFQCGYCTPGQICSAVSLVEEMKRNDASAATRDVRVMRVEFTDDEIRERMSGNICRCGAYPNIVKAVRSVAQKA